MLDHLLDQPTDTATALIPVAETDYPAWRERQPPAWQIWLDRAGFRAKRASLCLIPGANGELTAVVAGIDPEDAPWQLAGLPTMLPPGDYQLVADWDSATRAGAALGWLLGGYQFSRYKETKPVEAHLAITDIGNPDAIREQARAVALTRDLINTPAQDLLPEQLSEAARELAEEFGAEYRQWTGEELLRDHFPVIHAVGRASASAPRLIDLRWGRTDHPAIALVGKGVCFDSGGLDLKPASGMRLMKKDMGGAAHTLGLARLIMATGLPVRLRVLIPAVENAVSGNAMRPGDVLRSRKGITIEIDNTDAEGRLILCDALTAAVEEPPALILDFATLTGAARVAVGTEIAALFCNDPTLAAGLTAAADAVHDPIWRLPLHQPYRELLDSKVADIVNSSGGGYAGAITAALFLREFVPDAIPWAHFDIMAWNTRARPGRPEGGEAMGLRAAFAYLETRFGSRR